MSSIGKKILSAFVEVHEEQGRDSVATQLTNNTRVEESSSDKSSMSDKNVTEKFKQYFEQLFKESNLPGPDYFEFLKMVEAMSSIPDEKTRYLSAYAGLSVQGLDKNKLVGSAGEYIKILEADAEHFNSTINTALSEKVEMKKKELEDKSKRIHELTREITDLNNSIMVLGNEIKENEEKIHNNLGGYAIESQKFRAKINEDIQKINTLL